MKKKGLLVISACLLLGLAGCFNKANSSSAENSLIESSVEVSSNASSEASSESVTPSSSFSSESTAPSSAPSSTPSSTSSSTPSSSKTSSSSAVKDHDWTDERDVSYEHRIEKPAEPVHNFNELMYLADYYAFYKQESFDIQIASNYKFSNPVKNDWPHESVCLYDSGELMNGVMGFKTSYANNVLHFDLTIYHNAYIDTNPTKFLLYDAGYQPEENLRPSTYNDFATEYDNLPIADVYSTQQLWYAAQYGYKINPLPNSPAEHYYNLAKDVLRNICSDDMDDMEKYAAIFDYVTHNAVYDYEAIDLPVGHDEANYPDEYGARYKGYFIEGFFDNGLVVCDGYSKVSTLLGSMEGLDIVRATGNDDRDYVRRDTSGHAFCYLKIDGTTYLSDPTWCYTSLSGNYESVNHSYFLTNNRGHDEYKVRGFEDYVFEKKFINPYKKYMSCSYYVADGVYESKVDPDNTLLGKMIQAGRTKANPYASFEVVFNASSVPSSTRSYLNNNNCNYSGVSGCTETNYYPVTIFVR